MKFADKLKELEHQITHNQISKTNAKNRAQRLVEEAQQKLDTAKGDVNYAKAMTQLVSAKNVQARV